MVLDDQKSYLQNAIWGRGAREVNINGRHSGTLLCPFLILGTAARARDFMMGHVVRATLGAQLRELGEEPMPVFEETILMDCVEIIPVLICPVFIFLWRKKRN